MLKVYPEVGYDSFVSLTDANAVIENNSVHSAQWIALTDDMKEVYLRIATGRILGVIDADQLGNFDYCLAKSTSLMAIKDLAYGISAEVNPNTGLVSREKVGDIEVSYFHGTNVGRVNGLDKNPFPVEVYDCLNSYGADFQATIFKTANVVRK